MLEWDDDVSPLITDVLLRLVEASDFFCIISALSDAPAGSEICLLRYAEYFPSCLAFISHCGLVADDARLLLLSKLTMRPDIAEFVVNVMFPSAHKTWCLT